MPLHTGRLSCDILLTVEKYRDRTMRPVEDQVSGI